VTFLAFSLCIAVMAGIFGMLSGMLRRGVLSTIMMGMTFVTLVLTWVSFGVHLPVGVAVADFCYGMNDFIDGTVAPPVPGSKVGVAYFVTCFEASTTEGVLNTTVTSLASDVFILNRDGRNVPEVPFNISAEPFAQVPELESTLAAIKPSVTDQTNQFQDAFSRADTLVGLLRQTEDLLTCTSITQLYAGLEASLCLKVLQALDVILISQGLAGAFAVLAVFTSIKGMKRMRKLADHLKLNANNDDDTARGAFDQADEEEMMEVNARSNAHLDASKWAQI
jgi:hypothetical protein